MSESKFRIGIVGLVEMTADEIWPDGDAPENPTEADVAAAIAESGSLSRWLGEWNLDDAIRVSVASQSVAEVQW